MMLSTVSGISQLYPLIRVDIFSWGSNCYPVTGHLLDKAKWSGAGIMLGAVVG